MKCLVIAYMLVCGSAWASVWKDAVKEKNTDCKAAFYKKMALCSDYTDQHQRMECVEGALDKLKMCLELHANTIDPCQALVKRSCDE